MARGTRSRTPGRDADKRKLLATLKPTDFPSLVADILYFSKGHRHVKVTDGPGDGCRDIQSHDKDDTLVITQCKCFKNPSKTVGAPDANELVAALTKFGRKRGILATTGRSSPQLKREFTDSYPGLHLDWLDGSDIVDEVFSNPALYRAWVTGDAMGREKVFVKIPFVVRRAKDDSPLEVDGQDLGDGLLIQERSSIDLGALERFRPPESIHWTESLGALVRCSALLSKSPPDLHATEELHTRAMNRGLKSIADVATIRFGIPHLVPTKTPEYDKGFRIPGFAPRSYVLRPNKPPMTEEEFLLLSLPEWHWPAEVSALEAEWANWQSADGQRWCHIEVHGPSFPNSTQSEICRLIGASERRQLRDAQAIFVTATRAVCERMLAACSIDPDVRCQNGPGGELLGWKLGNEKKRETDRVTIQKAIAGEPTIEVLDIEHAIHLTARSDEPLVPSPAGEHYDPATLSYEFEVLPSPHYLKGRSCVFVEFWRIPEEVEPARKKLAAMTFPVPGGLSIWIDCRRAPGSRQTLPMITVKVPWPIESSTNEVVRDSAPQVDAAFKTIEEVLRGTWPNARCATRRFWETEIRFPSGAFAVTDEGLEKLDWAPEEVEEGDD